MRKRHAAAPPSEVRDAVNASATQSFFTSLRLRSELGEDFSFPYRQNAWVYACVRAKAGNISQVPFLVRKGTRKSSTIVEGGPLRVLFDNPNPEQCDSEFFEACVANLELNGHLVVVKEGRVDPMLGKKELPSELWPMDGKLFKPIVDKKTKLPIKWALEVDGAVVLYEPHQLVHIKYYNPYNRFYGQAPLEAAMSGARQDYKAGQYNEAFFDNDATPGGILVSKGPLTPVQRAAIRAAWEDKHRGQTKKHRVAVLEAGMEWHPNSQSHKDMEFLEMRRYSREEILACFKVPKSEVALYEDVNYATAQSADKGFWSKTLTPVMRLLEKKFQKGIVDLFGPGQFGQFDYDSIEALQDSLDVKLARGEKLKAQGYTPNMINEKLQLGMPKLPWGDEALVAAGQQTPESLIEAGKLANEIMANPPEPQPAPGEEDEEAPGGKGQGAAKKKPAFGQKSARGVAAQKAHAAVLKLVMEPNEARFRSKFKRYLMELRAEQIKLVKHVYEKSAGFKELREALADPMRDPSVDWRTVEDALFDRAEWDKTLASMHHPIYIQAATQSAEQAFKELGGNFAFDVSDPAIAQIAENRERVLVQANDTIRKRMAREIEAGVKAGETVQQIQDRIRNSFNAFGGSRSLTVARTEVAGTVNDARFKVMEAEGVETHTWSTAGDEEVRETHADQDGVSVRVGQAFPNGLAFPGQPGSDASEVVNCRCVAVAD